MWTIVARGLRGILTRASRATALGHFATEKIRRSDFLHRPSKDLEAKRFPRAPPLGITFAVGGETSPSALVMAREIGGSAGPGDAREQPDALSASRTLLVVARRPAAIAEALQDRGLPTSFAKTARQAIYWVRQQPPALVLLDLNVERAAFLLQQFRAEGRAILALSDDSKVRMHALEAGCLEAAPSSTSVEELSLKVIRAVRERRARRVGTIAAPPLLVDLSARKLVWHGSAVPASGVLVNLAACLALRQGQIVPTRLILEDVWGEPWASPDRVHRNMWRLRRTLTLSRDSRFLVARWREGYGMFPDNPVAGATGAKSISV